MAAALIMLAAARAACDSTPIGSAPATAIALSGNTIALGISNNIVRVCDLAGSSCTFRPDVSSVNDNLGFGATVAIAADRTTLFVGAPAGNVIERHRYDGAGWTGAIIADGATGTGISEVGYKGLYLLLIEATNIVVAAYKFTDEGTEYDRVAFFDGDSAPINWDVDVSPMPGFFGVTRPPTLAVTNKHSVAQLFLDEDGGDLVVWIKDCVPSYCGGVFLSLHDVSAALSADLAISDDSSLLAIGVTDGTFRVVDFVDNPAPDVGAFSTELAISDNKSLWAIGADGDKFRVTIGSDGNKSLWAIGPDGDKSLEVERPAPEVIDRAEGNDESTVITNLAESGASTLEGRAPFALTAAFVAASTATGAVRVWQRDGTGWVEHATIDYNADHIAIDGATLLVANDNDVPRVYNLNACAASRNEPTDNTPVVAVAGVVVAALAATCLVNFR